MVPSTKAVGGGNSVVCLTRTSRYRSKRWSWLVPLLPTFILSCLLSRIYRTGCNGRDDCGGPRSNAVDWATQVIQSKESWPEDWLSKQGVLAGRLAEQARSLDQEALVEQQTSQDRMGQQTSKRMLRTVPFLSK